MKTLAVLLVLLLQTAPIDPLAGLPAALRQLRDHLDEHRPTFGATPELTAAKHQLRDWIESRLTGLGNSFDIQAFADGLHTALGKAGLLCNDLVDQCDWNFLGYVDDVRISRADDLLVVVTATGIWCGYDESAYVYAWEGQRWRRVWEHERNTYTPSEYLPQTIHDVLISPPDASRARLLMTLGSQTICGGAFKDIYARAWQMNSNYQPARVLDWTAHANDAYPPLQGRVRPDDILFQFTAGGLLSGEVHTAVRHFKIAQGAATQLDPVAGLPRDFVVEWLTATWEESGKRSEPPTLEASHAQLSRLDGVGDFPDETVRRCTTGADVWQVGTHLYERPRRFFRVRWQRPYSFTMVGVSETPYPDCTAEDPRGETYSNLLGADLR